MLIQRFNYLRQFHFDISDLYLDDVQLLNKYLEEENRKREEKRRVAEQDRQTRLNEKRNQQQLMQSMTKRRTR